MSIPSVGVQLADYSSMVDDSLVMLEFRVLGPMEADLDGQPVRLGGAKERALLAILLIYANEVVSTDRLVDQLWGEQPPLSARTSLHNLVVRLRKALGPSALQTRVPGYVLDVDTASIDAIRFEELIARAKGEDARDRVETLEAALRLWRGPPFGDVFYESFAQAEIGRLEELRVAAMEELYAAKLQLGLTAELVPPLRSLVEYYPFRERLRQQLMLALYLSGRGVDALRTYIDWRVKVMEEWHMEPGRMIERTADAIRNLSPELDEVSTFGQEWGRPLSAAQPHAFSDPLRALEPDEAITILEAADQLASGSPDGLDALDAARIDSINVALLKNWRPPLATPPRET